MPYFNSIYNEYEEYNEFNDDDSISMFHTQQNSQLIENNNRELLMRKLEESKLKKNPELRLSGKTINHLPEELKTFDWITTLIIEVTEIKKIDHNLPPNMKIFICKYNTIPIFDCSVLPDSVNSISFQYNETEVISNLKDGIVNLDVSQNKLRCIDGELSNSLVKLNVNENKNFRFTQNLPNSLEELFANGTEITSIDNFNEGLKKLHTCRCNKLETIQKIPSTLKEWRNFSSGTKEILCALPHGMTHFDMYHNWLTKCPDLPDTMIDVDLSSNDLEEIPHFFPTIKKIDLKQNSKISHDDIETLRKEMPTVTIVFDFNRQYNQHTYHHNYQNYHNNNYFNHQNKRNNIMFKPEFAKDDPNVVVLTKTYVL